MYENYTLGIFEVKKESRSELIDCLKEISENLSHFSDTTIKGVMYKIIWYMGGEMKFLNNIFGVNSNFNNAAYPYFSCKIPKQIIYVSEGYSIVDSSMGARSHEDCKKHLNTTENM